MFVSIDPGLNHNAFAVWNSNNQLVSAGLARNPRAREKGAPRPEIWSAAARALTCAVLSLPVDPGGSIGLVLEIPKVRQRGSGKGDPNDLIDLAGVLGCIVGGFKAAAGAVVLWAPLPEEWKGQLPKEITELRVKSKLSTSEIARIDPVIPSLLHNVYDAIHLGLVFAKRA